MASGGRRSCGAEMFRNTRRRRTDALQFGRRTGGVELNNVFSNTWSKT